jgi:hypothetical protein
MLVKDRAVVGTHEQVLNVLITYRIYEPSKPMYPIRIDLIVLLQWLLGNRKWGRTFGSVSQAGDRDGRPFS